MRNDLDEICERCKRHIGTGDTYFTVGGLFFHLSSLERLKTWKKKKKSC